MNSTASPYREALDWIEQHPTTGSANSLAKLLLSFYNSDCSFAFSECIGNLDSRLTDIALRMAAHYARFGEDAELVEIGHRLATKTYPDLWEMSLAMLDARLALRDMWQRGLHHPGAH